MTKNTLIWIRDICAGFAIGSFIGSIITHSFGPIDLMVIGAFLMIAGFVWDKANKIE